MRNYFSVLAIRGTGAELEVPQERAAGIPGPPHGGQLPEGSSPPTAKQAANLCSVMTQIPGVSLLAALTLIQILNVGLAKTEGDQA